MDRIKKTLYLDPQEEKAFRDEAHESRISESELLRHYLKMIYGIKPNYCTRPALDECKNCSLVNYNRDCRNNKIKEVDSMTKNMTCERCKKECILVMDTTHPEWSAVCNDCCNEIEKESPQ